MLRLSLWAILCLSLLAACGSESNTTNVVSDQGGTPSEGLGGMSSSQAGVQSGGQPRATGGAISSSGGLPAEGGSSPSSGGARPSVGGNLGVGSQLGTGGSAPSLGGAPSQAGGAPNPNAGAPNPNGGEPNPTAGAPPYGGATLGNGGSPPVAGTPTGEGGSQPSLGGLPEGDAGTAGTADVAAGSPSTGGEAGSAGTPETSTDCTREALTAAAEAYVQALEASDPGGLTVSSDFRYTENTEEMDLEESIVKTGVGPIDQSRHVVLDVDRCSSFTEIIITDSSHPYVIGTRVRWEPTARAISEIESLVTDLGDWAFSAAGYLDCSEPQDWGPLPENEQVDRTTLLAAGDAYLDIFEDKTVDVPWDESSCSRLEGGGAMQEGDPGCKYSGEATSNLCPMGIPDSLTIGNRHHYVDTELGTVVVICLFGGDQFGMLDSHLFRAPKGLIHYVHTLSVDGNAQGTGWPVDTE